MLTRRHLTTTPTDKSVLTRAHTNFVATRALATLSRHIRAVSARLREISNRLATDSPSENGTETGTDWNGNKAPAGVDAGVRDHPQAVSLITTRSAQQAAGRRIELLLSLPTLQISAVLDDLNVERDFPNR